MVQVISTPRTAVRSTVKFTIRGVIASSGRTVDHVQFLTEHYALTKVDGSLFLHAPRLGGRFVVDRVAGLLSPIDDSAQRAQAAHMRVLLGQVTINRSERRMIIDEFACRLYRLHNDGAKLQISAEVLCANIDGLDRTVLHRDRELEAGLNALPLPLDKDEVVVRSLSRTEFNGSMQKQTYKLLSIAPEIEDVAGLDRLLDLPIAGE